MTTPFDRVLESIIAAKYHNQRKEGHSDIVSNGVWADLYERCATLRSDFDAGKVRKWLNVRAPGDRRRKIDLFVGEPGVDGGPELARIRFGMENKSVITAHRNKTNRYDDLSELMAAILQARPEAVLVATVIVGLATRYLNVADGIKEGKRKRILSRLSSGDQSLWVKFADAVSVNTEDDAKKTAAKFRELPRRQMAHTHVRGLDWLLLVPMQIDNVNPPSIPVPNGLGIDPQQDYDHMIEHICKAYSARWHS